MIRNEGDKKLLFFLFVCLHHPKFFIIYFFNFSNPNAISLNLNYLYHIEIHKVKTIPNRIVWIFTQTTLFVFEWLWRDIFPSFSVFLLPPFPLFETFLFSFFSSQQWIESSKRRLVSASPNHRITTPKSRPRRRSTTKTTSNNNNTVSRESSVRPTSTTIRSKRKEGRLISVGFWQLLGFPVWFLFNNCINLSLYVVYFICRTHQFIVDYCFNFEN